MKRRSRAEWKQLMEEHEGSGLTLAAFSEQKGIKKESFRWWRKVFRREERRRHVAQAQHENGAGAPLTQRLVDLLALGPATAGELAPPLGSTASEVQSELESLDELGLVYCESRKGRDSRWHLG